MRISELSRRSGVALPTIKYYLREGLLPPGRPTGATSSEYDEEHVRRLRLIRALIDVGGLSIAATRRVLEVEADLNVDRHQLLGTAMYALGPAADSDSVGSDQARAQLRAGLTRRLADRGWLVSEHAPAWDQLTSALTALDQLGFPAEPDTLDRYVESAERLAQLDLDLVAGAEARTDLVEAAVTLTVLYDSVLRALRRLAQENEAARRYRDPASWQRAPSAAMPQPRSGGEEGPDHCR